MTNKIGFACAYTPLPLIDATGGVPYRLHPSFTDAPDQAGQVLHDNMCPHVKRILDRAMAPDLPPLRGTVLVNSCDAMRRLADGWRQVRPDDRLFLLDLPFTADDSAIEWLASELQRLWQSLAEWGDEEVDEGRLRAAIESYNALARLMEQLRQRLRDGTLDGGSPALQRLTNEVSAQPADESLRMVTKLLDAPPATASGGVPLFLFGNVLPDPAAFELFEECGARIVSDDLCTGSRLFHPVAIDSDEDLLRSLARAVLGRPPCARTMAPARPGQLAEDLVENARAAGAKGVIAQIVKFCDPYLGRMPAIRKACTEADLPLLVLEGDCTLRSMGQQATRIEAFVEMLG